DILAPRKVRVKAHAQFEHGRYPPGRFYCAGGGLGRARDHLEQGALARAIDSDDPDGLASGNGEIDVAEHPLERVPRLVSGNQPLCESTPARIVLLVGLAQITYRDFTHQSSSTISPECLRKRRMPHAHRSRATSATGNKDAQSGHSPCTRMPW